MPSRPSTSPSGALAVAAALAVLAAPAFAASVTLAPVLDNSLYEESGDLSNGAGAHLFSGRTRGTFARRALLAFDVAAAVPAGATIDAVTLTLTVTNAAGGPREHGLHRVLASWGQAGSDAGDPGGTGTAAREGDATWTYRFWPDSAWSAAGGDLAGSASATTTVDATGPVTWASTPALVADVQAWLDDPSANFGWAVVGDEADSGTAKRFSSAENPDEASRPALVIEYSTAALAAGAVPDGARVPGTPLTVAKAPGGAVVLAWSASFLDSDADYEVYEGAAGDYGSHGAVLCSTGGAPSASIVPAAGSRYFLVVPHNGGVEGSYGTASDGTARVQGSPACRPRLAGGCPAAAGP